jgi:hypothetical protein
MTSSKASTRPWVPMGIVLGLVAFLPTQAVAKPDPFVGTWILNLAKSTFSPGPAPKDQTAVYAAVPGGYRVTATGTDGDGKPINTDYTAKFDGKDYPVTGNADYDTTMLKRVDAHTIEFTRKKAGNVVQTGTIVVSADGKTRTVTTDGTNSSGETVHNVSVYERK